MPSTDNDKTGPVTDEASSVGPVNSPLTNPQITKHHLEASTLFVPCFEAVTGLIVPTIVGSFFVTPIVAIGSAIGFVIVPTWLFHFLRYISLEYGLTESELVIQSGVVFKRERRIPFDRVQETEIVQSLPHRLLSVARLKITTAGSEPEEGGLNVISLAEAERIKKLLSTYGIETTVAPLLDERAETEHGTHPEIAAMHTAEAALNSELAASTSDREYSVQVSLRELIMGGLSSTIVTTAFAIVGAIAYFRLFVGVGHWFERVNKRVEASVEETLSYPAQFVEGLEDRLPEIWPLPIVFDILQADTLWKSILLATLGLVTAVVAYLIRFQGFELIRQGDLLNSQFGLITVRRSSLARERIQALKLEEGLLRRWLGLASVRVDSAGDRQELDQNKKRDVLIPVAYRDKAVEVAVEAIPGLRTLEPEWSQMSPLAIMRGTRKGWILTLLVIFQGYFAAGWYCLLLVPLFPAIYFLNLQWFRCTGFYFDELHFLTRKGWLNQSTLCVPIRNIQSIAITQNFFDRRLNLARIAIDTAGQSNTGGGPQMRHIPLAKAQEIQHLLSQQVATTEYGL